MIKFTKEEKTVLLFLLAALFTGTIALHHKKESPAPYQAVDYSEKKIESIKVDINKATPLELIKLKNIGPVTAERIVSYRKKHGPFKRIEDIKNVKGIGEKTFRGMRDSIVLE